MLPSQRVGERKRMPHEDEVDEVAEEWTEAEGGEGPVVVVADAVEEEAEASDHAQSAILDRKITPKTGE